MVRRMTLKHRHRHRHTDRHTYKQTDKQTERPKDIATYRLKQHSGQFSENQENQGLLAMAQTDKHTDTCTSQIGQDSG